MSEPADLRPYALVVDDEAIICMEAAAILEDAGFRTLEVGNGDDALVLLAEYAKMVTLLFTDVDMPGSIDGFALARETARLYPEIEILVASGRHKPEPEAMPNKAHFVEKPFSGDVINDRLKVLLPDDKKPEPLRN